MFDMHSHGTFHRLLLGSSALGLSLGLSLTTVTPAQAQGAASAPGLEEVVVTGSRIVRRDDSSDSPLMTITTDTLQATSSISIEQQLAKMPQFTPGDDQFNSAGSTQATPTTSPGI